MHSTKAHQTEAGGNSTSSTGSAERLLDAADVLMAARGYHDVGVAELCREADVRPGSFYYYYDSKEALAAAMLHRSWKRTDENIFAPSFDDQTLDSLQAIGRYAGLLEANLRLLLERSGALVGCRFGNFATETAQHLPLVQRSTQAAFEAMTERFTRLIERGQRRGDVDTDLDPASVAILLLAQMEGLMVIAKATGDPSTISRLVTAARLLLSSPDSHQ